MFFACGFRQFIQPIVRKYDFHVDIAAVMKILYSVQEKRTVFLVTSFSCLRMWGVLFDNRMSPQHLGNKVLPPKLLIAFQLARGFLQREAWGCTQRCANALPTLSFFKWCCGIAKKSSCGEHHGSRLLRHDVFVPSKQIVELALRLSTAAFAAGIVISFGFGIVVRNNPL